MSAESVRNGAHEIGKFGRVATLRKIMILFRSQ